MIYEKVTRENLPSTVERALNECIALRVETSNGPLIRDLDAATYALRLIQIELQGKSLRPQNQRSSAFTRYVIDEDAQMVMSKSLKDFIVKIEDLYKRY